MDIKIRKLTPEMAEDYAHFFDVTPHDVNIDERKCYCVTWRSDESLLGDDHWYPTREERRSHAIEFVKNGWIQGYFAYCGDSIVGWCNANANCQKGVDFLSAYWPIEKHGEGIKVKSIFCFAINPKVQRMGIATKLVERVCRDAAEEGLDFVEAYVNKDSSEDPYDFRGPLAMYQKCGFIISGEREGKVVVRKALK